MSKKIMVLDVEGMSTARPYNIGFLIADKHGNILQEKNFAILSCIWENLEHCFSAKEMTHDNIKEILVDIDSENRKYNYLGIKEAKKEILSTILEFKVKEIWAYNCAFDKGALSRLFGDDFSTICELVTFYDIIPAILFTKLLTKKYVKFCQQNGFVTEKGNIQTKAEIVYKYLTNDISFVEEHTGLADCKIEYNILLAAIKTKKKINHTTTPAWRLLKQFCEEKEV